MGKYRNAKPVRDLRTKPIRGLFVFTKTDKQFGYHISGKRQLEELLLAVD